jgi:hypothetical protein
MENLNGTVKILKKYSFDVEKKFGEWVPIIKPDTPLFTYIDRIYYFDGNGDYIKFLRGNELYSKRIEIKKGNEIIHKSYDANGKFECAFSVNEANKNEEIVNYLDENMNITESIKTIFFFENNIKKSAIAYDKDMNILKIKIYTFENNIKKSAITYDKDMNILAITIYTIMNGKQISSNYFYYEDSYREYRMEYKYDKNGNVIYYSHIRNGNKYEKYYKYNKYDKNGNWIESMDFKDKELTKASSVQA